ncbi:uncharacterized protein LY79DRAFT_549382 [Colletotrichum navitas]|uniref:Uncharacterized protein n=1 Tax=Colletotrichum navitas TaxID=681940 RepID=A0AAD8V760_9PEZI|nr:uncharacterized protein LY79DRAFT_549382 [Colletotrichum navitas]KAK1594306.1 hypothetical protein LY79DRAFT_549382 [Colletotrichum navitas]
MGPWPLRLRWAGTAVSSTPFLGPGAEPKANVKGNPTPAPNAYSGTGYLGALLPSGLSSTSAIEFQPKSFFPGHGHNAFAVAGASLPTSTSTLA